MKLVIDARESGTSTGRYVDKLIEYLARLELGVQVEVLAKTPRLTTLQKLAPKFRLTASDFKEFTFAEQLGLKKQIRSLNADLVHFTMTQQPLLYRGKKITTVHDLTTIRFTNPAKNWLLFKFKQFVYRYLVKRVAQTSAQVITPSQYVKDDLIKFSAINPNRVQVIYEAADKITVAPKAVDKLKNSRFLMYVGRPTPHKNLNRLVEAFEILQQKYPELKLVLVGKTDANYQALERFVSNKNLTSQVIFTGFIEESELRWLYESCQAYVFPSLSEGFGLPALEAMAHGAPVVSSQATCLPEIYADAAIYFNPVDINDMASKIDSLLANKSLRQDLIEKGLAQAGKYSWEKTAQQTLELYKQELKN